MPSRRKHSRSLRRTKARRGGVLTRLQQQQQQQLQQQQLQLQQQLQEQLQQLQQIQEQLQHSPQNLLEQLQQLKLSLETILNIHKQTQFPHHLKQQLQQQLQNLLVQLYTLNQNKHFVYTIFYNSYNDVKFTTSHQSVTETELAELAKRVKELEIEKSHLEQRINQIEQIIRLLYPENVVLGPLNPLGF